MPTPTYTPLANITLSSSAASVTFSSISQAYRDLVLITATKGTSGGTYIITFNSDTGSNYSLVTMYGNGSSTFSTSTTDVGIYAPGVGGESTTDFTAYRTQIFDYSQTDKHKSVLLRFDRASLGTLAAAGRWANTAAITTVTVRPLGNTFQAGSSFALYGIAA